MMVTAFSLSTFPRRSQKPNAHEAAAGPYGSQSLLTTGDRAAAPLRPATCPGPSEATPNMAAARWRHADTGTALLAANGGGADGRRPGLVRSSASVPQKRVKVRSERRGEQQRGCPRFKFPPRSAVLR